MKIDSRVRFQIQDLIDDYEKDWKHEIFYMRRTETDGEGFQKKYVPKGSKLAHEATMYSQGKRSRANSSVNADSETGKKGAAAKK